MSWAGLTRGGVDARACEPLLVSDGGSFSASGRASLQLPFQACRSARTSALAVGGRVVGVATLLHASLGVRPGRVRPARLGADEQARCGREPRAVRCA